MGKSLRDYDRKRDFTRSAEPRGDAPRPRGGAPTFVVHRHEARRLHYDLRLEMDGVLRSWAVPKGFSYDPSDKRLAVRTEDHPLAYEAFEGTIPEGQYGAGTMLIFDRGTYALARGQDAAAEVAGGELKFVLFGRRLRGEWHLVKTRQGPDHWLLFKAKDRYVAPSPFSRGVDLSAAVRKEWPRTWTPIAVGGATEVFADSEWVFEMRFDGPRTQLIKRGDEVRFRGLKGLEHDAQAVVTAARRLAAERCVIDGVLSCLDDGERPSATVFEAWRRDGTGPAPVFYAFDMPWYEDLDLRKLTLLERKAALAALIPLHGALQYVDHVLGDGPGLLAAVQAAGLPGIVAKRSGSRYRAGPTDDWLAIDVGLEPDAPRQPFRAAVATHRNRAAFRNLEKVYWPADGLTKGDLIDHYARVADLLLPHVTERPIHLHRFPDGIGGKSFYQKQVPAHFPDWIETVDIHSESSGKTTRYPLCNDRATLLYLVNTGSIDLHPWLSRRGSLDSPDWCVFDLDPKEAPFRDVVRIARVLGRVLRGIGLRPLLKTSGKSGLHVYVPLLPGYDYGHSRMFAEGVARVVVRELEDIATLERGLRSRGRKVYVDVLQNRRGQSVVPPYCVRPVPGARVSMPLDWDELDADLEPAAFTIRTAAGRLAGQGDRFRAALDDRQDLLPAIERLEAYVRGDG